MLTRQSNPNFTTDRPVAVLMVFLAAVVFGYFSLSRLPVTLMPEMSYPTLTVRTEYPGAAPEEVENDVSRPIEEQLGVVGGLNEISSISRAGVSDVVLEFVWGVSMSDAIQNTLEKLDQVFLPQGAEKPLLLHYDPSLDPVMELSLSLGDDAHVDESGQALEEASARRLRRIAELQVKRALEPIKGVAAARVRGGLEEEIHVMIKSAALDRANLSINQVINRLNAENINAAGGRIREGTAEYMVRTINEYERLDEIADTVVVRQDGREIRVRDLGEVVYGQRDREMLTRTNGGESVQIDIYKEADSNMVQVGRRIRDAVGQHTDPKQVSIAGLIYKETGVLLEVVADRSVFIANSINEVKSTAITGGFLAIIVLYLFLRDFRTTAIIGVSIPISIFVTFAPLNMLGVSLNIMSLGGLAMGIGMLVDSSIVVLESIYRCREEGDSMRDAAIRGAREVRGAVIASTLTSVCVFFPMVFVEGMAGQIFNDLGLTVVTSLIASVIVAILFIPMLASRPALKLQAQTAALTHPLAGTSGHLSPRLLFQGFLLPSLLALLAFVAWHMVPAYLGSLQEPPVGRPKPPAPDYLALSLSALKQWGWLMAIPSLIALTKTRPRPAQGGAAFQSIGGLTWSARSWRSWVALPYLALRIPLGVLLELIGVNLVWALRLVGWVVKLLGSIPKLLKRSKSKGMDSADRSGEPGPYAKLLGLALNRPALVIFGAAACVALTFVVGSNLDSELLPEVHQSEFTIEASMPVGTPLDVTEEGLRDVESTLLARADELGIESLLVMYGFDASNMKRSDEGEHSAKFRFLLADSKSPKESEERVITEARDLFQRIPDLNIRVTRPVLFSSKKPIVVQINGEDLDELKSYSDQATSVLTESVELADVEPTLRSGAPEVQITYDRLQIIRHGLSINTVAGQVRDLVKGSEATRLNRKDRRVPIVVRLDENDREQVLDIGKLTVNPGAPTAIPLESIAELSIGEGPSEIRRIDGKRVALVQANIGGGSLGAAVDAAKNLLSAQIEWPLYMDFLITGQNKEWEQSRGSLFLALGLSLFLVYVIMASQFESILQPLIIMFSIPMAFIGTVIGLALLGINLSVVVFLGLIMLAGIVVNNAIVLVDYTNTLRTRGMALREAIVTAGQVRLRPILMTTATTVLGLLPMAMGLGEGAEIRSPMAIAVISGLLTSTFLTLILIPTLYYLLVQFTERVFGSVVRSD